MKWAVVTLNNKSIEQGLRIKALLGQTQEVDVYTLKKYMGPDLRVLEGGLKSYNQTLFDTYPVIIYVMAMGIIVRDIAPYMKHKSVDPAVLCLSIDGQYIIPVLSGHLGGANAIAHTIAHSLGASPVITTASDLLGKTAVDMMAKANGLGIGSFTGAKDITAMMINEDPVDILSDVPTTIEGTVNKLSPNAKGAVYIGYKLRPEIQLPYVKLIPKRLVLGIGARRDTPFEKIMSLFDRIMREHNIDKRCIKKMTSIDIKEDEQGIIELAKVLKVPFITYTSDELNAVMEGFESSEFVKKITGVGAVSMPSGYLGSKKGQCLIEKIAEGGITMSLWEEIE